MTNLSFIDKNQFNLIKIIIKHFLLLIILNKNLFYLKIIHSYNQKECRNFCKIYLFLLINILYNLNL